MILRYIIVRSAATWCAAVSVRHDYVTQNGKVAQNWTIGTQSFSESYAYNDPADGGEDADGSLKQMTTATGDELRYTYDELNRLTSRAVYRADGTGFFETRYAFKSGAASNQTTAQVEFYSVRSGVDGTGDAIITYQYVYDALGNITEIRNGASPDELLVSYQYDDQNQLIKETYANGEYYDYIYDTAGNLREVKKNGESIQSYTYDDTAWSDLLTAFMEQKIAYEGQTYDASNNTVTGTALSGNPVSYYNGTRWNFDWENGRQLITAEKTEGTTNTELSYTYDADGIRTSKTYTVETHEGQHTVTFVADGTTVKTMTVDGGYILQDGDYPTVPDKTGYNGSWQQYTAEIHADVTIQATYTIKTYTVSFMKGTLRVARKTFSHGYVLNDSDYPTAPTGYEWERYTQPICSNIVIHAIETTGSGEKYTVTFWASRQLLKTMTVVDGYVLKNSDYPAVPPRTGYTGSWNKYTGAIHESITITARYTKNGSVAMSVGDETELLTSDISAEEDLTPVQDSGEADAPAAQAGQTLVSTQTVRHDYVTQNGKVVRELVTDATTNAFIRCMDFIYDESGRPFAMRNYWNSSLSGYDTYHYILNAQGDVVQITYQGGTVKATYTYDAWGQVLTATGDLAAINPLRYRGYYYDTETGFYYLQSRYYDPVTHRFINADSYESTGQGFVGTNMFAYCNNIPTSFRDDSGHRLSPTVALHESMGGRSGNIIIGGDGENANIDNMMQFFGVSLPEELPDLGTDTMVFLECVESVSFGFFSILRGHTIVMDNDKYCEYWFTGYSFGLSALFADSSVSAGYVHGVKNPNDYAGLFFGTNVNAVVDGKGVAIAPNGVTAEILTIYGNLGFSSGASITGYSACSEQWIYGAAPIKWYNAWQSYFGLNQDTYL